MNFIMFKFILYIIFSLIQVKVKTEIAFLGEGIEYIEEDDIAIIFFVTVKNICKDDLELSVNMVQCCETVSSDETDCNSMILIGGDMGILPSKYVKNLTLIYPNLYLFNRRGVCTISVTYRNQFKKKEITTDIHFDTAKSCPGKQHARGCPTIDLDNKANCNPVDCLIKYSGTTSYFNPECKRCQKVPKCISKIEGSFPDVAYSPYSNECIDLNIPISKKDLEEIENNQSNKNQTTMINAICHYGKVTNSGECLCHDGWTTASNDEGMYEPGVAQHHLCNIQVGDWHCINKRKIRITTILITILAVTIISKVLLLMCLMTFCYKHYRKPEKICARELDPDDKSIILCEDLESFDKCLCCTQEKSKGSDQSIQKPTKLHSQTVNVSYYPSCPSAFSSIKASSGSSKFTDKTEPTIDLSNTTSSANISFPEGDSSDQTENSDDSVNGEDNSNDIAYGVYCNIDELEEEEYEEEEEIEEEQEEEEEENLNDTESLKTKSGVNFIGE